VSFPLLSIAQTTSSLFQMSPWPWVPQTVAGEDDGGDVTAAQLVDPVDSDVPNALAQHPEPSEPPDPGESEGVEVEALLDHAPPAAIACW
jgi:hypothetical protein